MTSTIPSEPKSAENGSIVMFALVSVIATGALALVAAHAPPRIRLLGLYTLAFGLLNAFIQTRLAAFLNVRLSALVTVIIAATTFAGIVGSVLQTVALQPQAKPLDASFHPVAAMVEARMEKTEQAKESAPTFAERMHTYLMRRVSILGDWSSPWPEAFWGCELILGTVGAACLTNWIRRTEVAP